MRTSYSALETYKNCPLKYKFQEVDKIRMPKGAAAVFGTIVHSALNYMFERNPLYPTIDEVIDFYATHWKEKSESIIWSSPDRKEQEEKMYFDEGLAILKNFYKKNQPWMFNVVELEGRFSLDLLDEKTGTTHTLAGIIDRLDKDPETGRYEIIDYKTGKRMPSEAELVDNLQLGVYHLALTARWPSMDPENFTTSLYFLKHNEKVSVVPSRETLVHTRDFVLKTIREIEEHLQDGNFPPMPSPLCGWCSYQKLCPMWAHEFKDEETKTASDAEVAEAIQEFFEIKKSDDKNKKRLAEIRGIILQYMQQENLARVFGESGYITKNVQERTSFDLERAEPLLKKGEVWEKILEPSEKKLEKLLTSLPQSLQEEILKFETKKMITVLKPTKKKGGADEEEEDSLLV